jgi:hypothetical protein
METFILALSCRGISPWAVGSIISGPVVRPVLLGSMCWRKTVYRAEGERRGRRKRRRKNRIEEEWRGEKMEGDRRRGKKGERGHRQKSPFKCMYPLTYFL